MHSGPSFRCVAHLIIYLTGLACAAATAPAHSAKAQPNVILITIDTVRADHVGCYGAKDVQTPTLDSLARDGIVFERAISQVPLTWPSHTVILTGTYPFQNGVQDFTGSPLDPKFRSAAQAFKDHGYRTGAVVSAFVLDRSWGLARGFDFYDDAFAPEQFKNRDLGLVERRAGESVTRALLWLVIRTRQTKINSARGDNWLNSQRTIALTAKPSIPSVRLAGARCTRLRLLAITILMRQPLSFTTLLLIPKRVTT